MIYLLLVSLASTWPVRHLQESAGHLTAARAETSANLSPTLEGCTLLHQLVKPGEEGRLMAVSIYILLSTIKLFTIFRKSSVCSPAGKPVVSSGSGRFCSAAIVHFVAVVVLHAAYIYIYTMYQNYSCNNTATCLHVLATRGLSCDLFDLIGWC